MSDAIICAEHAVSSLLPLKTTLEMMKENDLLTERVNQLERQAEQERKQAQDNICQLEQEKQQAKEAAHLLEQEKKQLLESIHKDRDKQLEEGIYV